jgi:outer membrane protein OmpA-like peptidoglycan-associated protein
MKTRNFLACLGVAVICAGLLGCAPKLSGKARLGPDGLTAILEDQDPLNVQAAQPELPPPPPKKAKIVEERIEISEKVQFAYNDSTILEASHDLLNDVGLVMKQHPEVKKIRIEGHASSEGEEDYNKDLSDRRAKAVMDFLIDVGIDSERMEAIGYGEERPIASNDTEEGREKNRRVEFNIIARLSKEELEAAKKAAEKAAAGVDEGAVEEAKDALEDAAEEASEEEE